MVPALSVVYRTFTNSNLKECRGIGKIYSYRLTGLRQWCDSMTHPGVHSVDELRSKEAVIRRDRQAVRWSAKGDLSTGALRLYGP